MRRATTDEKRDARRRLLHDEAIYSARRCPTVTRDTDEKTRHSRKIRNHRNPTADTACQHNFILRSILRIDYIPRLILPIHTTSTLYFSYKTTMFCGACNNSGGGFGGDFVESTMWVLLLFCTFKEAEEFSYGTAGSSA